MGVNAGFDVVLDARAPEVVRDAARRSNGFAGPVPCLLEIAETWAAVALLVNIDARRELMHSAVSFSMMLASSGDAFKSAKT